MPSGNDRVVRLLEELARLTEVDEGDPNSFRVRAYRTAARTIDSHTGDVTTLTASQLAGLKGIGRSTAAKIREIVDTGTMQRLEELREAYPPGQLELLRVPGLGPRTLALLAEVLGIRDLDGLKAALDDGRLAELPGMGEKTCDNLARAIERMHLASKTSRRPIHEVLPVAERIVAELRDLPGVEACEHAGSLRRFQETIGDVDILVAAEDAATVMDAFVGHEDVHEVVGRGDTKASVVTRDGLQMDLRVVRAESYGAALLYFTGSKAHNIRLRQLAIERGWKLSEYAVEDADTGDVVAARTEVEVYEALGLAPIAPELREDAGEIELARDGGLPDLVDVADLRGDLHDHTDASGDGRNSLEEMVAAAHERGLDYLAITDHAEDLRINGVSRAGMLAQRTRVRELEQERGDIRLLHGAELNIARDGSLDYDQSFLEGFDWCVASVHSAFNRPVAEQTARIVAAMRNPAVNAIGHLTGRRLGKRPGIELDLDAVFAAAVETGTAIEINGSLQRLDASADVIREGAARGVTFVISTDAHTTREFDNHRHGVRQARRGQLDRDLIANTWPAERFLDWVAAVRSA